MVFVISLHKKEREEFRASIKVQCLGFLPPLLAYCFISLVNRRGPTFLIATNGLMLNGCFLWFTQARRFKEFLSLLCKVEGCNRAAGAPTLPRASLPGHPSVPLVPLCLWELGEGDHFASWSSAHFLNGACSVTRATFASSCNSPASLLTCYPH